MLDDAACVRTKAHLSSWVNKDRELNGAGMDERLNGLTETAERLGVSIFTIRRLIKDGSLRAVRVSRRVLVPESEVLRTCAEGCSTENRREEHP